MKNNQMNSVILGLTIIITLIGCSAYNKTSVNELSEVKNLSTQKTVERYQASYQNTSVDILLKSKHFYEEFDIIKKLIPIILKGINHPEFKQAILLFPNDFWEDTNNDSQTIYNDIVNHHHKINLGTTKKNARIITYFRYQTMLIENTYRSNIFKKYKKMRNIIPYVSNALLHEMIHLVQDKSREGYRGYIHKSNNPCLIRVQQSAPYTFANIFEAFIKYKIRSIKKLVITYKDVEKAMVESANVVPIHKNRFLVRLTIKNKSANPITNLGMVYNYLGCKNKRALYSFTTQKKNFFSNISEILPGKSGTIYLIPINYWGFNKLIINQSAFPIRKFFKKYPLTTNFMSHHLVFEYTGNSLKLKQIKKH